MFNFYCDQFLCFLSHIKVGVSRYKLTRTINFEQFTSFSPTLLVSKTVGLILLSSVVISEFNDKVSELPIQKCHEQNISNGIRPTFTKRNWVLFHLKCFVHGL